jgi:hypothetical protein
VIFLDRAQQQEAADLTVEIRLWLNARHLPPQVMAAALVYELAAMLAREAPDEAGALQLIDLWTRTMKNQVRAFGAGVEHP